MALNFANHPKMQLRDLKGQDLYSDRKTRQVCAHFQQHLMFNSYMEGKTS